MTLLNAGFPEEILMSRVPRRYQMLHNLHT